MNIQGVAQKPLDMQADVPQRVGNDKSDVAKLDFSPAKAPEFQPSPEQVKEAVDSMNAMLRDLSRGIQFSIDKDTGITVVKVIDKENNEVIRQMPAKETLQIAKDLDRLRGLLLHEKA